MIYWCLGQRGGLYMKKNDYSVVEIIDINQDGEGIGKVDGYTLFIKDTVVGDVAEIKVIKAKKSYGYGRLVKLIKPSEKRVAPRCPVARQCGGCQLQAYEYQEQLRLKEAMVRNNLDRIGKLSEYSCEPIIGMDNPWRYRNKAQFPIGRDKSGNLIAGFYAGRTHSVISCDDCVLGVEENKEILSIVMDYMREYYVEPYCEESHSGQVRHVLIRKGYHTGHLMVCIVINGRQLPHGQILAERLAVVNGMKSITISPNQERTNVILGKEIIRLWGDTTIEDRIGDVWFEISPLSFFQVNPVQTEKLYAKVLEYAELTGREVVWDLYCGIGTISLFLAKKAGKVYGVEIVPAAIDNARQNALKNGVDNAEFFVGKAEEVFPEWCKKNKTHSGDEVAVQVDVIVVDPPRKGCEEGLLQTMVEMQPERIVYVSCDSATLARDLKKLEEMGYRAEKVQMVDMFPQTRHVETIVLLSHKSPDSVINVKVEFGKGKGKVPLDAIAERAKKYQPKPKITYKMIQEYVEKKYGFKVHTAYIAEVKRSLGLTMYDTPNAVEELKQPRKHPPKEKVEAITDALKYFEVI